jgi:DNA polymerase III sliding clamp (beta) subunit (PCNA family)
VKLRAKEGDKKIKIEAQSMESGENMTEVESAATLKGSAVIAFNNRYLIDGLSTLSSEEIYIGFNDSFGPVIFREVIEEKIREDFLHIIMPIRS